MLPENYNSIGVSANVFAGPTHGFDTLFDEFVDPPRYQPFVDGENAVSFYHNSDDKGFLSIWNISSDVLQAETSVRV